MLGPWNVADRVLQPRVDVWPNCGEDDGDYEDMVCSGSDGSLKAYIQSKNITSEGEIEKMQRFIGLLFLYMGAIIRKAGIYEKIPGILGEFLWGPKSAPSAPPLPPRGAITHSSVHVWPPAGCPNGPQIDPRSGPTWPKIKPQLALNRPKIGSNLSS